MSFATLKFLKCSPLTCISGFSHSSFTNTPLTQAATILASLRFLPRSLPDRKLFPLFLKNYTAHADLVFVLHKHHASLLYSLLFQCSQYRRGDNGIKRFFLSINAMLRGLLYSTNSSATWLMTWMWSIWSCSVDRNKGQLVFALYCPFKSPSTAMPNRRFKWH